MVRLPTYGGSTDARPRRRERRWEGGHYNPSTTRPMARSKLELPHPLILLLGGVAVAAALTWIVPAGAFERRDDPATGRRIAVAGTYHAIPRAPVDPLAAAIAVPR